MAFFSAKISAKGKASGVVIGGKGVGLLTITQGDMVQMFQFSAEPAK